MTYPPNIWNQLKNKTADKIILALEKDGWVKDSSRGAVQVYYNPTTKKRTTVHYHPQMTYKPNSFL